METSTPALQDPRRRSRASTTSTGKDTLSVVTDSRTGRSNHTRTTKLMTSRLRPRVPLRPHRRRQQPHPPDRTGVLASWSDEQVFGSLRHDLAGQPHMVLLASRCCGQPHSGSWTSAQSKSDRSPTMPRTNATGIRPSSQYQPPLATIRCTAYPMTPKTIRSIPT